MPTDDMTNNKGIGDKAKKGETIQSQGSHKETSVRQDTTSRDMTKPWAQIPDGSTQSPEL
jgi:hypothetical protein